MNEELIWNVGTEAVGHGSLVNVAPKAYFYWRKAEQLVRSEEFTESELEVEIARLRSPGDDVAEYEHALKRLRNLARPS